MFELCYSSGLRLSELASVTMRELDLDEGTIRVTGKGNKTKKSNKKKKKEKKD